MTAEFIEKYVPSIITGLVGLSAWIYERRTKNAKLQQVEADAISGMQAAYRTYVDDSNVKYAELKKDIEALQGQLFSVQGEVLRLQKEVVIWKGKYEDLKEEMNSSGINRTSNDGTK